MYESGHAGRPCCALPSAGARVGAPMTIRLIALDLDGTLLDSRGRLSERNRASVASARAAGASVALVTGRRFRDARPLALELGLDVPVIAHNGALTKHAHSLETVSAILMPVAAARAVVRLGRAHGADALVSDDHVGAGLLVYDHLSEGNTALAKYIAWSRRVVGEEAARAIRRVPSLDDYLDHDPLHVAFSGGCAAMDAGLAAVAAEQGLGREEVLAVGDNFNDLEMLEWAGTGVVMGNADPALRERAGFHTTASNDEDGVADAIERFV